MSARRATGRPLLAAATLAALAGCAPTFFTDVEYSSGQRRVPRAGAGPLRPGDDKARVIELLGPPGEVLPHADGDVFTWRLRHIDLELLQLNAGLVTSVPVPLWVRSDARRLDDTVMVFFDRDGRVSHLAASASALPLVTTFWRDEP